MPSPTGPVAPEAGADMEGNASSGPGAEAEVSPVKFMMKFMRRGHSSLW